jgi:hypothetical protein
MFIESNNDLIRRREGRCHLEFKRSCSLSTHTQSVRCNSLHSSQRARVSPRAWRKALVRPQNGIKLFIIPLGIVIKHKPQVNGIASAAEVIFSVYTRLCFYILMARFKLFHMQEKCVLRSQHHNDLSCGKCMNISWGNIKTSCSLCSGCI